MKEENPSQGQRPLLQSRCDTVLGTLDAPHKVPRHPGLPGEEHRGFQAPLPLSPFYPAFTLRAHGKLRLETTSVRLAPALLPQDARMHIKHSEQSRRASRASRRHGPTPACGISLPQEGREKPWRGRDTRIDSAGQTDSPRKPSCRASSPTKDG